MIKKKVYNPVFWKSKLIETNDKSCQFCHSHELSDMTGFIHENGVRSGNVQNPPAASGRSLYWCVPLKPPYNYTQRTLAQLVEFVCWIVSELFLLELGQWISVGPVPVFVRLELLPTRQYNPYQAVFQRGKALVWPQTICWLHKLVFPIHYLAIRYILFLFPDYC